MTELTYEELDNSTLEASIAARLGVLERQYLDIELRVSAPGVGEAASERDTAFLTQLADSIAKLRARRDAIRKEN